MAGSSAGSRRFSISSTAASKFGDSHEVNLCWLTAGPHGRHCGIATCMGIPQRHAGFASEHPFERRVQQLRESRVGQSQTVQLLIGQPGQGVVLLRGTVGRLSRPLINRPDVHPEVNAMHLRERVACHLGRDAKLFVELANQRQARDLTDLHVTSG